MKVHMGAGARFVEVEVEDKNHNYHLADLQDLALTLWEHTDDPRVESMGVGFTIERSEPWGSSEPVEPDRAPGKTRSRPRRRVGAAGLAGSDRLAAEQP